MQVDSDRLVPLGRMALRHALGAILLLAAACASDPVDLRITGDTSSSTTTEAAAETSIPAAAPPLTIAPWSGHRMALSWTFDDGDPSHLGMVIPLLGSLGIPGTFYPTCSEMEPDLDEWVAIGAAGFHEIANHTMTHVEADGSTDTAEIADCHDYLVETVGVDVSTFAYPAGTLDEPYLGYATDNYVAARASWAFVTIVRSSTAPDWSAVPSVFVGDVADDVSAEERIEWPIRAITDTDTEAGWLTLTFHSVGTSRRYGSVSTEEFERVIAHSDQYDVWHGTFADVASYHRGRLAVLGALPERTETDGWVWSWEVPNGMTSIPLLATVESGELLQQGRVVERDAAGRFLVNPSLGELGWQP